MDTHIEDAYESIITQLKSYGYVCVDDYLKQIAFEGDLCSLKRILRDKFRNGERLDKEKLKKYNDELLEAKTHYEEIQKKNTETRHHLELTSEIIHIYEELEKKKQELFIVFQELEFVINEIHFNKNKVGQTNLNLDLEELKEHIKELEYKREHLEEAKGSLELNISELKQKIIDLNTQYNSVFKEKKIKVVQNNIQVRRKLYNIKIELKDYLIFTIYEEEKLYIYNVLKYSLEIIKDPNMLQDVLKKFRNIEITINERDLEESIKVFTDNQRVLNNFYEILMGINYFEIEDYDVDDALELIYEFIESYNLFKLCDVMDSKDKRFDEPKYMESTLYYRGQSNSNFLTIPSVFRSDKSLKNEHIMYHEINVKCPNEVQNTSSHLEVLAIMQHYSLPTRLLDITTSPLTAVFFAIEDIKNIEMDCELIVSRVADEDIKYYDSDTIEILCAISTLRYKEKQKLRFEAVKSILELIKSSFDEMDNSHFLLGVENNLGQILSDFNNKPIVRKLNNEIKKEWKTELRDINPLDILRICFVKPKQNNNRIIRQQGAFIVSGLMEKKMNIKAFDNYRLSNKVNMEYLESAYKLLDEKVQEEYPELNFKSDHIKPRIIIPSSAKKDFKDWLLDLGIDETSIYPEFEKVAGYLKAKYS